MFEIQIQRVVTRKDGYRASESLPTFSVNASSAVEAVLKARAIALPYESDDDAVIHVGVTDGDAVWLWSSGAEHVIRV